MPVNPGFQLDNLNNETVDSKRNAKKSWDVPQGTDSDNPDEKSDGWFIENSKEQCGCSDNLAIKVLGGLITVALIWLLLYTLFEKELLISGGLFQILLLVLTSYIVGQLVAIIHLPPLLGMLITGIIFKTSGFYKISGIYTEIVIVLREAALCIILIRAGLGLDAAALLKLSLVVFRLALLPCIGESLAAAAASHFIFGYPWIWGILLGFLLSAVSPAVVVPTLLSLKERGYGEDKGIATLVIGASSLDDITAISVFGICLGMIFSQGDLTTQMIQGPKEVLLGLSTGIGWGFLVSVFPNKNDALVAVKRCILIGSWGLLAVIGSQKIGCPGSGPLSTITASLVAGIFWKLQGWSDQNPASQVFANIWIVMQPILFGLIGAEVDLRELRLDTIGYGLAVICCGLCARVVSCFIAVTGTTLNFKEKIFVNLAWIPKATVQAALASKALDTVNEQESPKDIDILRGTQILTIAVLSILVTAPLGAIGVATCGPVLLTEKKKEKGNEPVRQEA